MRLSIVCVGRPGRLLAEPIAEYERRAARYWNLIVHEVRAERAGKRASAEDVRRVESRRLVERVAPGVETIALTRAGEPWDSRGLARYLERLASSGQPGAAFLIGGAFGLDAPTLERADRRLSLSSFTLPHELARLVFAEQLYRAGTLVRREPYHKAE